MKKNLFYFFGLLLLCSALPACQSSSTLSNPNSVVGKWEFVETDVDINTGSPIDLVLNRALSLLTGFGTGLGKIKTDIEFTKKGQLKSDKINCQFKQKGDVVTLDQDLLRASKVSTNFIAYRSGDELHLTYDLKDASDQFLKGFDQVDLSKLKDGKITFIFENKRKR